MRFLDHLQTARGLAPQSVKVFLSGVMAAVAAAGGSFPLHAPLMQRVLRGMVALQGKQVQAPAIVAHEWLAAIDMQWAWDLLEHQLEWVTAVTLASFFGWRASNVYSVPLPSVC